MTHNQWVLNHLREYDSFLDSLKTIADMGCGTGEDIAWWATLETRDDPPVPYNYTCYAVDKVGHKLAQIPNLPNVVRVEQDFSVKCIPRSVDLMWAHDSLQYSTNPLQTLRVWNEQMTVNGMLVLCVPQHSGVEYNRYQSRSHSGCFYQHTPVGLLYMLAVNGFDIRDAYVLKKFNDPWIHIAVYKSDVAPMDPTKTSWFDLIDTGLLHPTIINSINTYGYLRQEDILYSWLDKENYYIDYVVPDTDVPTNLPPPTMTNEIVGKVVHADTTSVEQPEPISVGSALREPYKPSKAKVVKAKQPTRKKYE